MHDSRIVRAVVWGRIDANNWLLFGIENTPEVGGIGGAPCNKEPGLGHGSIKLLLSFPLRAVELHQKRYRFLHSLFFPRICIFGRFIRQFSVSSSPLVYFSMSSNLIIISRNSDCSPFVLPCPGAKYSSTVPLQVSWIKYHTVPT